MRYWARTRVWIHPSDAAFESAGIAVCGEVTQQRERAVIFGILRCPNLRSIQAQRSMIGANPICYFEANPSTVGMIPCRTIS